MNIKNTLLAGSFALVLGGCATDSGYYASHDTDMRGYGHAQHCDACGTVENISQFRTGSRRTSGGGAVIGALVGGAVGNQFGKGDGRTAATVAGAVVGGVAGNEIERNRNGDEEMYEVSVRMDDGRRLTFEQYRLDGIREGSRVIIDNGVASLESGDW